jgi:hypothetical protein
VIEVLDHLELDGDALLLRVTLGSPDLSVVAVSSHPVSQRAPLSSAGSSDARTEDTASLRSAAARGVRM